MLVVLLGIQEKAYASSSKIISIKAGGAHVLALKDDGTVWAWGDNYFGQLGDGTDSDQRNYPIQINELSDIIAIDAGEYHSVALKNDGTVWAWGRNLDGELGDGTYLNKNTPIQIGIDSIIDISCGDLFTIALKNDGTVWSWGDNEEGQLGIGSYLTSANPVKILYINDVISIRTGNLHTLALKNNGELYSWGKNTVGQCGNGTTSRNITNPVYVINGISAIGVGGAHSFAITNEGTVLGWGTNTLGQLGIGTYNNIFSSPVEMKGISNVKCITGGNLHTIVLKNDGTVWVCGSNKYGGLGDGHIYNDYPDYSSTFIQLNGISEAKSIAGGIYFTIALLDDGSVWGCGINDHGQLGE